MEKLSLLYCVEMARSNPQLFAKTFKGKSLAQVVASMNGCTVDDLIRLGVHNDAAVELMAEKNDSHKIIGSKTHYVTKTPQNVIRVQARSKKVQKPFRKAIVLRKKTGEVQAYYERGGKMVRDLKGTIIVK